MLLLPTEKVFERTDSCHRDRNFAQTDFGCALFFQRNNYSCVSDTHTQTVHIVGQHLCGATSTYIDKDATHSESSAF